jgi:hypothetical protein
VLDGLTEDGLKLHWIHAGCPLHPRFTLPENALALMLTVKAPEAPTAIVLELGLTEPGAPGEPWLVNATITRWVVPPLVPLIANGTWLAGKFEGMVRLTVAEFPAVTVPEGAVNVQV